MGRFDDKVVIVTGATKGLGLTTAKLFLQEGAKVIAVGRNRERLEKELSALGPNVIIVATSVQYQEGWDEITKTAVDAWGKIDVLVNNAGVILQKDIHATTLEEFKETLDINCVSVFLGMKNCYPFMPKGENSSIVNVSSIGGIKAGPDTGNDAGYNASKAAVRNLSKHASYVYAPDRIRVNSVHPGGINTEMMQAVLADHPEIQKGLAVNNPLPPYFSESEDVANAILFLASDQAKTITGTELVVDNGNLAI